MFIFLPDSPVTAKGLSIDQRRLAVRRLRGNQTGVENKHFKWYQVREAFLDVKLPLFFLLGTVGNIPNGGISNFGTIIIKGFGFSTLVTTLMQIPYGVFIALSILACVFLNNRVNNKRCLFILIFLCPNIAGAFGLRFVAQEHRIGRYICYLLTGPYNAAFVLILSLSTANTAGHSKKIVTNGNPASCNISPSGDGLLTISPSCPIPRLLYWQHCWSILLQNRSGSTIRAWDLEHDSFPFARGLCHMYLLVPLVA